MRRQAKKLPEVLTTQCISEVIPVKGVFDQDGGAPEKEPPSTTAADRFLG